MNEQRQCGSCGMKSMERAILDVNRNFQGHTLTIPAVDGWHCPSCGEVEFASREEAERFFDAAQANQKEATRSQAEALSAPSEAAWD